MEEEYRVCLTDVEMEKTNKICYERIESMNRDTHRR